MKRRQHVGKMRERRRRERIQRRLRRKALRKFVAEHIDLSDISEATKEWFTKAKLVLP